MAAQNRTSVALNVNANDAKLRDNRVVRFAHFAVLSGGGNLVIGNHFFQGDDQTDGLRQAGLVFTSTNCRSVVSDNYIDNCWIEWSNEHDPEPGFDTGFSFGGVSVASNTFMATNVAPSFRWLVVKPRGPGHFLNGLSVTGNVFRSINGTVDRIEKVDTTQAGLNHDRARNVLVQGNVFHGVGQICANPVTVTHDQATAAATWTVDASDFLPFGGKAVTVCAVVAAGALRNAANAVVHAAPYTEALQGAGEARITLKWPEALKGAATVTLRSDTPL